MTVVVVPPNPGWANAFAAEAHRIMAALEGVAEGIHHIGSTAIHGIPAKPVIDILLAVGDLKALDQRSTALEDLGYEVMGEFGIPGRRYFRKEGPGGVRTHQVHAFHAMSEHLVRHIAFRDFMNAHRDLALAYGDLKVRLALEHPNDMQAYMSGKDGFIKENELKALTWIRHANRKT
ncbi:MAG TPA: GrpB family protein [Holophagaceae bacterium]|nr:GrpB family protein [Holophagaceae bacterium]